MQDAKPWMIPQDELRSLINRVRAGRTLQPASWPDGARFAVALSFDCDHESFEIGAGGRAIGRLAWGEFGRRVGLPRVLDVLRRHDVLTPLIGSPPVGFRSANWDLSPNTIAIVEEMGLLYDSSLMADEVPYELLLDGRATGVVEIPVEWLRDDAVYMMFNRTPATRPWMTPDDVYSIFKRELEAAAVEGSVFQLVMHPFVIGYRSRIWILEALIEAAKDLGGAWFATHADIARWVRDAGGLGGRGE